MRKVKHVGFKTLNNRFGMKLSIGILILIIATGGAIQVKNAYAYNRDIKNQKIESQNKVVNMIKTLHVEPEIPKYNLALAEPYQELIWQLCLKNDISYELVLAVFWNESRFNFNAINKTNKDKSVDYGFSMINSRYINDYKDLAVKYCDFPKDQKLNPMNPDHAIRAGIGGLVFARSHWINKGVPDEFVLPLLLGSYNHGVNWMENYLKKNNKIDTVYSDKVMAYKIKLETSNSFN